jgi:hypothetical protein
MSEGLEQRTGKWRKDRGGFWLLGVALSLTNLLVFLVLAFATGHAQGLYENPVFGSGSFVFATVISVRSFILVYSETGHRGPFALAVMLAIVFAGLGAYTLMVLRALGAFAGVSPTAHDLTTFGLWLAGTAVAYSLGADVLKWKKANS